MEAFKALNTLYSEPENIGMLQLFTERFKTRFIEMAACEPELSVRRTAVSVLESIDRHGLLEEDQQAQLAGLIFHVDVKVRHIIAPYFISRVNEESKEVLESGANPDSAEQIDKRIWLKCFAQLLVRQAQRLDAEVEKDGVDFGESQLATTATLHDLALTGSSQGRFGAAVEAVWGVDEGLAVKDWEALANYILLDHSGNASNKEQQELDEHQLLEEAQEGALVEVLVAAISCIKSKADIESRKVRLAARHSSSCAFADS